jgi:hypothetical protein
MASLRRVQGNCWDSSSSVLLVIELMQVKSRVCHWATISRVLRFRGLNCSPEVVFRTRPPSVRWNAWEEINCFLSRLVLSISHVITLAPFRVSSVDPSSLPKADSLSIANQSWACQKRGVSGWFWDIGQVSVRNFDWLPFTPPLVAVSGPSVWFSYMNNYVSHFILMLIYVCIELN